MPSQMLSQCPLHNCCHDFFLHLTIASSQTHIIAHGLLKGFFFHFFHSVCGSKGLHQKMVNLLCFYLFSESLNLLFLMKNEKVPITSQTIRFRSTKYCNKVMQQRKMLLSIILEIISFDVLKPHNPFSEDIKLPWPHMLNWQEGQMHQKILKHSFKVSSF